MKKIGFLLFLFFEKLIAILPFAILYLLSDLLYFILFYIIKYRKNVIIDNLRNSFPNKNNYEIIKLHKYYLQIMADLIIESIKSAHLSKTQLLNRVEIKNPDLINHLYQNNKSVFIALGHTGNWEMAGMALPLTIDYKCFAIYQPQTNILFDEYIKKNRSVFGLEMIASQKAYRKFLENRNELILSFLLGDQSPSKDGDNYWTSFLNQETAFFTGLEKMAKSLDFAVVFLRIIRLKRGRYQLDFELLTDNPKDCKTGEISEMYVKSLEKLINEYPENWLWSHRRWKHKKTKK